MPVERGGWTTYGERPVYESPWVDLRLVDVESPAGERFEYHVVALPPFASALVVDDREQVLLLWKYRFPVERWGYELPGGMVDDGESPAAAAARETAEETGWRVRGSGEHLFTSDPLPGQVRTRGDVFRWYGADHEGDPTDPEEAHSSTHWVPLDRAPELVTGRWMLDSVAATALIYQYATTRR